MKTAMLLVFLSVFAVGPAASQCTESASAIRRIITPPQKPVTQWTESFGPSVRATELDLSELLMRRVREAVRLGLFAPEINKTRTRISEIAREPAVLSLPPAVTENPQRLPMMSDDELKALARTSRDKYEQQMDKLQLHLALEEVFKLIQRANKYIDETAPWQLAKDESKKARLASVLYNLLECLRISLIMLQPYNPESCDKAFAQIGACEKCSSWDSAAVFGALPADVTVRKGETLFPRLDMEKALAELEKMNAPAAPKFDPIEPEGTIDDFSKCDMRVCKVLSCEAVKKSKKHLKFKLDDGTGTPRQILSGIPEFYAPEQLVGKTVVAILTLPNRKMMGEGSCGMLISAVHEHDGKEQLHLLMLDDNIPAGFRLC